jgi:selenocysteine lyase/cysteine desulfurase
VTATRPSVHEDLLAYRGEFPILGRKTYLNTCSLGALSHRSMRGLAEFQELWNEYGASAWYKEWIPKLGELRAAYGRVIGGWEEEIALSPNVSTALTMVASCLDYTERPRVVVADADFPTIAHQWLAKRRLGVEVVSVPSEGRTHVPLQRWEEATDGRTALVATSHVLYTSGQIQDVAAIAELAHSRGALCLVDGYQSVGQIPVDVRALGVDFYIGGSLKWLLGGQGMAFLWVRPDLIPELQPTVTGWFAAESQFSFDNTELRLRGDAGRFEYGTPAIPTVYTALGGLSIVEEAGVGRIRERTDHLTRDLVSKAHSRGFALRVPAAPEQQASITMVEVPDAPSAVRGLAARGVIGDHRYGLLRLSPYFYNTEAENDRALDALEEVVRESPESPDRSSSATTG